MTDLPAALDPLRPRLADRGNGLRTLIHAEETAPLLTLLRASYPKMELACVADYPGLAPTVASFRPQLCLSYRFGPGYPREVLVVDGPVYVHVAGSGFDHLLPWDPNKVLVCSSKGFQSEIMADYVLGAVLALNLRLPVFMAQQAAQVWQGHPLQTAHGQLACVLGTGVVGAAIASRLRSVRMKVTGISRSGDANDAFDSVLPVGRLNEILGTTDHLVIALPRTAETEGLVGADTLARLPKGATVINLARGGIVDEQALLERLLSRSIGGAVLDVFATEPLPTDNPLWHAPNVIITPHSSALFNGWEIAAAHRFLDNLTRLGRGEPPLNVADPRRGY